MFYDHLTVGSNENLYISYYRHPEKEGMYLGGDNALVIFPSGNVYIGSDKSDPVDDPDVKLYINGDGYFTDNVSALSFTDRTPYPSSTQLAYDALFSMQKLPDDQYDEHNKEYQLDHTLLHDYIKGELPNTRDISATVSVLTEVVKDLVNEVNNLKQQR